METDRIEALVLRRTVTCRRWGALLRSLPLLLPVLFLAALANAEPVPVITATVKREPLVFNLALTGTITSAQTASLSARTSGLVETVAVDAGAQVKAGDMLLQLDTALAEYDLAQSRAAMREARQAHQEADRLLAEARRLAQTRAIPETEMRARAARAGMMEAAFERLVAEQGRNAELLARHTLRAPFDGVISAKLTETGEWVETGTTVLELVSLHRLRLDVQVPQEYFPLLTEGDPVRVHSRGPVPLQQQARISALVPVKSRVARTALVRIALDPVGASGATGFTPGAAAVAEFTIDTGREALLVPADALLRYVDGSSSVWLVEEHEGAPVARRRRVETGRTLTALGDGDTAGINGDRYNNGAARVEVRSGLEPGAEVVTRGNESLREGQPVRRIADPAGEQP